MSAWNRRKKYSFEDMPSENEKPRFRFSKLVKHQMLLTIISVFGVCIVILGSSYAFFSDMGGSSNYNTIKVGTFEISFDDTSSGLGDTINLNGAYPMTDAEGQATTPYKFKITNKGSLTASYSIYIGNDTSMIASDNCSSKLLDNKYINFYLGSSVYGGSGPNGTLLPGSFCDDDGANICITSETLQPGATDTYQLKLWINESAKSNNNILGRHYHGKIIIKSTVASGATGKSTVLSANQIKTFSLDEKNKLPISDGLFNVSDDDGTSYVFRGDVNNNWVKFGKDGDQDLYWRIIRINGDETIRLVYNGTSTNVVGETTVIPNAYSYSGNDKNVLEYDNDLSFKHNLDDWYNRVFAGTDYEKNIATTKFCVDTQQDDDGEFSVKKRIDNNSPSLKCLDGDNSVVKTLKVGTISVDEANITGLTTDNANTTNYLYNALNVWTMSPYSYQNGLQMWSITNNGLIAGKNLSTSEVRLRPVINLNKTVSFSGSGTVDDPYVIK